jgi:glycyl-tRNA synthetase
MAENKYDKILDLATRKAIFFPASEIYKGPAGFYDYGPIGATLKRNIIELWRKNFVEKDGMLEIDGSPIMPPKVFEASGHLASFQDPLTECRKCKAIYRADKLIEEVTKKIVPEALKPEEFDKLIKAHKINCPKCKGELTAIRMFNLMTKTFFGPKDNELMYFRPETCQSIFVDFQKVFNAMRAKLPIGLAQVGLASRNEISPRQGLFRTRQFTQMEVEVFFNPKNEDAFEKYDKYKKREVRLALLGKEDKTITISLEEAMKKKYFKSKVEAYYLALLMQFYESLGIKKENMRLREIGPEEKPFYAKSAWDFEIMTSFGWTEIVANHYRSDHDLKSHSKGSGQDLSVIDGNEKVLPWVWEDSFGVDRTVFAVLDNAYTEETVKDENRIVLKLNPNIAPIQVAIFPLVSKDKLPELAQEVCNELKDCYKCFYDESGSIGKRYRRMDEIGTPFCITIDFDSLKKKDVTVRNRDTMKQERIKVKDLCDYFYKKFSK